MKGWPVGEWLSGDAPFMKISSVTTMLLSLGLSFYIYSWRAPLLAFVLCFILGFIATQLLKSLVQFVAVIGTIIGWVLCLNIRSLIEECLSKIESDFINVPEDLNVKYELFFS
jgi:hypothetical protein